MDVLCIALGSAGDVNPFVGLGVRLRSRGHRVTLLANGHFESTARRVGLEFQAVGTVEEYHRLAESPGLWEPYRGLRLVAEGLILAPMRGTFAAIEERYRPGETVVVAPLTAFGARIARDRLGVPLVSVCLQPNSLRSEVSPPILKPLPVSPRLPRAWNRLWYGLADRTIFDPMVGRATNAFRAELGLPKVPGGFATWAFSPDRVLGLFPDWYAPPQPDWPAQLRLTGFPLCDGAGDGPLPAEVARFLDAGSPPIIFTPGSAMNRGRRFFEAAVDACRRLDRRAVLLSPAADQFPRDLPPSILACAAVPFGRLFPVAAAAVHHGGIGTASQALRAGIPQLIMPMAFDQHDNAARLERLGVGRSLSPRRFRGPLVAERLAGLLESPAVAAACDAWARRLGGDLSLDESCRVIEEAGKS